jgi:two-component system, LytTR family, response regulator AlgR
MKLLIADDEGPARERLRSMLLEIDGCEVVGEAANGYEALTRAHELQPDVLLLDIRMPGMDGLEAARHIAALANPPAVIFTTAYGDYALDAFAAQALDYLLKPIEEARLTQALARARRFTQGQLSALGASAGTAAARTHISAHATGRMQVVPVATIRYFQADSKYVTARFPGGQVLLEEPLKTLEQEFAPRFLRIHRNALVALPYVESLLKTAGTYRVGFAGVEETLEVSRRHLAAVRRRLKGHA